MKYTAFDGNLWRVERLKKAARITAQIANLPLSHLEFLIAEMRDYKGTLEVTWHVDNASFAQKDAFATAWELCGEKRTSMLHLVTEEGADWGNE